jgi:metallo-beta-lactamase family protein
VLLIPSFAIGRTQEIVWELDRLVEAGRIPELPVYLDSPMAKAASDVYRAHPEAYDEETATLLREQHTPLDYPNQHIVQNVHESQAIERSQPPYVIVASNGMLTGGRSVGHAEQLLDDPSATVLFVGYQGEGTLGGHLVRGVDRARINGKDMPVRATVRSLDGFSAHADEPELLAWLGGFIRGRRPGDPGVPSKVYLVHGDPPAQAALLPKVQALGLDTEIPAWHQTVAIG